MKKGFRKGQGLVEYILLVALIALVAIVAVRLFGGRISSAFRKAASAVGLATGGGIN